MDKSFNPYDVVYTVLITERGTNLTDKFNKYLFKVNPSSNKVEIKAAVEAIFPEVKVSSLASPSGCVPPRWASALTGRRLSSRSLRARSSCSKVTHTGET